MSANMNLSGSWKISLMAESGKQEGMITIPGILQAQGYGNDIDKKTPWVSELHDPYFYEREEYSCVDEKGKFMVSFLSQPKKHFIGIATYSRLIEIEKEDNYFLFIELVKQKTTLYIDGKRMSSDFSLCTPHVLACGVLSVGTHEICVEVDNTMQYDYRPDGHAVSDALGSTWNGMAGEVTLMSEKELEAFNKAKYDYAKNHPIHIEVRDGEFFVNGSPEYFRGTHMGGDFPITGFPSTDVLWWKHIMQTVKEWGLNFIRFHSFCPPEAAFVAADEEGVYLQVECGMWNTFEEGLPILEVLRKETKRILESFGHHPSFCLFSPSNEPSGYWYKVLREWVSETREVDIRLGYKGRRVYTAQSGWYYEVEPSKIEGTDYIYFHRSAYGPYLGGMIRNHWGWKGKDYSPSLTDTTKPVISHELGQWCAYPDFSVIDKYTGYLEPGNYKIFKASCEKNGLLPLAKQMAYASGRSQVRLFKEDLEATFRTKEIKGFELLELHDYSGQGTALVGVLDAFWDNKGYTTPEEFRDFCGPTVILARFDTYIISKPEIKNVEVDICHYGKERLEECELIWKLDGKELGRIKASSKQNIAIELLDYKTNSIQIFETILAKKDEVIAKNNWKLHFFAEQTKSAVKDIVITKDWKEAYKALKNGEKVIFNPYLSDLSLDCPSISMKNVFWNSQMGPTWDRSLGMLIDNENPLFKYFPTDMDGGWQWENIFQRARAFNITKLKGLTPLVRVIDDWNRNLPLSFLWEAKAGNGRLLFISAELEAKYEERSEAYTLYEGIKKYVMSEDFNPKYELSLDELNSIMESNLLNVFNTQENVIEVMGANQDILDPNPNKACKLQGEAFPFEVVYKLKDTLNISALVELPDQRERIRNNYPKDFNVLYQDENKNWNKVCNGQFPNSSLSYKIDFNKTINTDCIKLEILSSYGDENSKPEISLAGLHIVSDNTCSHEDICFWVGEQSSKTKEIEG